MTFRIKINK
uniref:Uncharacterized protein n=1 Tax=Arundo donax TaxID=35708 RepID=A0A0A8Y4W9_ARUDO